MRVICGKLRGGLLAELAPLLRSCMYRYLVRKTSAWDLLAFQQVSWSRGASRDRVFAMATITRQAAMSGDDKGMISQQIIGYIRSTVKSE